MTCGDHGLAKTLLLVCFSSHNCSIYLRQRYSRPPAGNAACFTSLRSVKADVRLAIAPLVPLWTPKEEKVGEMPSLSGSDLQFSSGQ